MGTRPQPLEHSSFAVHCQVLPLARQISEYKSQVGRLVTESKSWKPTPFYHMHHYDKKKKWSPEGNNLLLLARQRATSWLKINQHVDNPRIYPFLGSEHFFFGSLEFEVKSLNPARLIVAEVGNGSPDENNRHFIISASNFINGIFQYSGFLTYVDDVEDYFEFFPVFNLSLKFRSTQVGAPAFLIYHGLDEALWFVCPDATWLLLRDFFSMERTLADRLRSLPLVRWAGIYSKPLETAWLTQAKQSADMKLSGYPSEHGIYKAGYIPGVCMICVMVETGEGTTKVRIPTIFRIGNTSNGSIWCLHSSIGQEYGEVLVGQMEQIWALAGSPPRFSITATKCYLPKRKYVSGRRKLYVALVELGNS
jgi:hypothetical protein